MNKTLINLLDKAELTNILVDALKRYIDAKVNDNKLVFNQNLYNQIELFLNDLKQQNKYYYFYDSAYQTYYLKTNKLSKKENSKIVNTSIDNHNNDKIINSRIVINLNYHDKINSL